MKKKILISAPYLIDKTQIDTVFSNFDKDEYDLIIPKVNERLSEDELMSLSIVDVEGIICGDDQFTKRVIDNLPNLKVIVKWGTGIDSIDKNYAKLKGIKVLNTLDAFTNPVAETTIGLILSFTRAINKNNLLMKNKKWTKPKGRVMEEMTIGIIGFGRIGYKVAEILQHFNAPKIIYYDIQRKPTNIAQYCDFNQVLKKSDIITLHCDLNSSSKHILNANAFKKMKKKPYVINTARGGLINQSDLKKALSLKQISGAGLDVYENEPKIDEELTSLDNVIMLSHNANSSQKYWNKVHKNSIKLLKENL